MYLRCLNLTTVWSGLLPLSPVPHTSDYTYIHPETMPIPKLQIIRNLAQDNNSAGSFCCVLLLSMTIILADGDIFAQHINSHRRSGICASVQVTTLEEISYKYDMIRYSQMCCIRNLQVVSLNISRQSLITYYIIEPNSLTSNPISNLHQTKHLPCALIKSQRQMYLMRLRIENKANCYLKSFVS